MTELVDVTDLKFVGVIHAGSIPAGGTIMADVIDFNKAKLEQEPHISGLVHCLSCKHEWTAVAPLGTVSFECPNCGLMRGTHTRLVGPEDGIIWTCGCGNHLFVITAKYNAVCIGCGNLQSISHD